MSANNTHRTLVLTGPRRVGYREESARPLGPDDVRLQTLCTGISRGTEMGFYRGTSPRMTKTFDFSNKLFRTTHADREYPFECGYESIGRITEAGSEVRDHAVGDIVFSATPHTESVVVSTVKPALGPFGERVPIVRLPPGLPPHHGLFLPLLGVAYNGILDGQLLLGETVIVFGCGVTGLLTVQLARMAGAELILAVDPHESRRELARRFGANHVFDPADPADMSLHVRELTAGRGADLAIDVSGSHAAVHEAIRSVGYNGRVVVGSFLMGGGDQLRLGEEFHFNRVQLISSQIGGVSPALSGRWSSARRTDAAVALLARLELEALVTHRIPFEDAQRAFEVADEHRGLTLQIILDYGRHSAGGVSAPM